MFWQKYDIVSTKLDKKREVTMPEHMSYDGNYRVEDYIELTESLFFIRDIEEDREYIFNFLTPIQ